MLAKTMTAALLSTTLLATAAFAQTPSATTTAPAASTTAAASDSTSYTGDWRASKVVGLSVYNDSNESLGSINDLLMNKEGQIQAVVIGVGGFLGVGERYVAIPYAKVKFVDEPVKTAAAPASGSAMPGASPSASGTASTTTTGAATGTGATTAPAAAKNPWYPDHAVVSATKDELKGMAEFKYATK